MFDDRPGGGFPCVPLQPSGSGSDSPRRSPGAGRRTLRSHATARSRRASGRNVRGCHVRRCRIRPIGACGARDHGRWRARRSRSRGGRGERAEAGGHVPRTARTSPARRRDARATRHKTPPKPPKPPPATTNGPTPWGRSRAVRFGYCSVLRFDVPQVTRNAMTFGSGGTSCQAAWRTNCTSRLIVTSLPSVKPPASSAAFQFTPNSVRSILVVASAPNLTWP